MTIKEYPLSLSVDYLAHWTVEDAIREILQNALDRGQLQYIWNVLTESNDYSLAVYTPDVQLHQSLLLLGNGTKQEGDRGGFGEGFKLALLILAREGMNVKVTNGNKIWTPVLRDDPLFGTEMLYIIETENPDEPVGLMYEISGLTSIEKDNVEERTLAMHTKEQIGEITETNKGRILHDKPNMIYVGGLYVCKSSGLECGYDFNPNVLELNRDRQAVPSWDMKREAQNMWLFSENNDKILDMVLNVSGEMDSLHYNYERTQDTCKVFYEKHIEMHGDVPIADTKRDLDRMISEGYTDTVFIGNENFSDTVRKCKDYKEVPKEIILTPTEILKEIGRDCFEEHSVGHPAVVIMYEDYQELIERSKGWKT